MAVEMLPERMLARRYFSRSGDLWSYMQPRLLRLPIVRRILDLTGVEYGATAWCATPGYPVPPQNLVVCTIVDVSMLGVKLA
jgi:hypothetical protein